MHLLLLVLVACTHASLPVIANAPTTRTIAAPEQLPVDVYALPGATRDAVAESFHDRVHPALDDNRVTAHALPRGWLLEVDLGGTRVANTRVIAYREDLGIACDGRWNAVVGRERGITQDAAREHVAATCRGLR